MPADLPDHLCEALGDEAAWQSLVAQLRGQGLPQVVADTHFTQLEAVLKALATGEPSGRPPGRGKTCGSTWSSVDVDDDPAPGELELAALPFETLQHAQDAGCGYELALRDPVTLLPGCAYLGQMLQLLSESGVDAHVVLGSAGLDNLTVVNERWSRLHGDLAVLTACRRVTNEVSSWNTGYEGRGHCVIMRLGGDALALAIVLRGAAVDLEPCRELAASIRNSVRTELQALFPFSSLNPLPLDRHGTVTCAVGPSISLGVSRAVRCGRGHASQLAVLNALRQAGALLGEWKTRWRDAAPGEDPDAGVKFQDDALREYIHGAAQAGGLAGLLKLLDGCPAVVEKAADALRNLTARDDYKAPVVKGGALPVLLRLLAEGGLATQEHVSAALRNLAVNDSNKVAIMDAGGLPALVKLLNSSATDAAKANAAGALRNLARTAANKTAIAEAGGLPALVRLLGSDSAATKEKAAAALWNLAASAENRVGIAEAGGLPALVRLLSECSAAIVENAAGALRNLAASAENRKAIAEAGGLAALVEALGRGSGVAEKAADALRNLAVTDGNKVGIAEAGGIPALLHVFAGGSATAREFAAGALRTLSVNDDNKLGIVAVGGLRVLACIADDATPATKDYVAGTLRSIVAQKEHHEAASQAGVAAALVRLLRSGDEGTREKAVAALWHHASADASSQEAAIHAGAVPALVALLRGGSARAQEKAAAVLWDFARPGVEGSRRADARCAAIVRAGGLAALVQLLEDASPVAKGNASGALRALARDPGAATELLTLGWTP